MPVTADLFGARPPAKLRLTRVVTPEDDIHQAVAKALQRLVLPPAEWTCFPAGNIPLPAQWAAKLVRFGLQPGWPDFLVLHEWVYGIELKRVGAGLSKTRLVRTRRGSWREVIGQEDVFPRLERAGMTITVCRSVDEVLAALRGWDIPMRKFAA
jgi:hypothetical protein